MSLCPFVRLLQHPIKFPSYSRQLDTGIMWAAFCVDSIVAVTFVNYASLSISRARSRAEKASGYDWHLSLWKVAVKMWQTPLLAPCFPAFLLCLELLLWSVKSDNCKSCEWSEWSVFVLPYSTKEIWALCGEDMLLDQKKGENIWNVEVIWPSYKCVLDYNSSRTW